MRSLDFADEALGGAAKIAPILCTACMCLPVDQCQRVRSFDLLSGLARPSDRQQSPSFWTVRRRHTSAVSAHYGFNKCKPKTMPLGVSSFHSLLEHVEANLRSKSRTIILHDQRRNVLACAKFYGNGA